MAANFDLKRRLGEGYFGEVWLARDAGLDIDRAIKIIKRDRQINSQNLFAEAQLLKAAEHPNVVRVEETGFLDDGSIYLAMEYLPKGSLEDEVKGAYVDLSRVKRIMVDLLRGLEHAHRQGILHRDIKPANILLGDQQVKLSDFGLALDLTGFKKTSGVLKYDYQLHLAPEILNGGKYSQLSDIYACGFTMYRLVNGDSYLPRLASSSLQDAIANGTMPDRNHYRLFVPQVVKKIINKALQIDPAQRFQTVAQLRHAIEQMPTFMNWKEAKVLTGFEWLCANSKACFEVALFRRDKHVFEIQVRRGPRKSKLRRISAHCAVFNSEAKALAHAMKILQGFVIGKYK